MAEALLILTWAMILVAAMIYFANDFTRRFYRWIANIVKAEIYILTPAKKNTKVFKQAVVEEEVDDEHKSDCRPLTDQEILNSKQRAYMKTHHW